MLNSSSKIKTIFCTVFISFVGFESPATQKLEKTTGKIPEINNYSIPIKRFRRNVPRLSWKTKINHFNLNRKEIYMCYYLIL